MSRRINDAMATMRRLAVDPEADQEQLRTLSRQLQEWERERAALREEVG